VLIYDFRQLRESLCSGTVALCVALCVALFVALGFCGAAAAASPPTLLIDTPNDRTGLQVRPTFISFYEDGENGFDYLMGPGLTQGEYRQGKETPIVWTHWGVRATGRATYWVFWCGGCRYRRYEVRLTAWRVRKDHYTRLSIARPGDTVVYAFEPTRIAANGVPGGLPAYTWCWAKYPKPCVSP
jgi:hypothetical protein